MFIIYDLTFILGFLFYFPMLLFRRKAAKHHLNRLGFFLKKQTKKTIWLHAVSVGEVNCLKEFVPRLKQIYPDCPIVFSTVTATGNCAAKNLKGIDYIFYLPFDLSFIVNRFIKLINPKLVIIVETEFWPNFISSIYKNKIPIAIINGRISDRSYKKYKFFRFLFKNILKKIDLFCMQAKVSQERLISLGVDSSKVKITGNMKFDTKQESLNIKSNLKQGDLLLACGSTHPGEEEKILEVYKRLSKEFTNLRLLIAPRHIERVNELEKMIVSKFKFNVKAIKNIDDISGGSVFLVNAFGILGSIYSIADIVFIGGSLVKKGGQNILEPAFFEKPIIIGQHYFNFSDIVESFKETQAVIVISDTRDLESAIRGLIVDKAGRLLLGIRAKETLKSGQGATIINLELIKQFVN